MNKLIEGKVSIFVLTLVFAFAAFFLGRSLTTVSAVAVDKIDWCHCQPNGGCQTLNLPLSALLQAGHVDANGSPLHAGDYAGECDDEQLDLCTNIEGSQESIPEGYYHTEEGECFEKTPVCANDSYENYGGEDGVFDQETEVADNELCSNEPSPTPTSTPSGDVCLNQDGIQTSVPEGQHLGADGTSCVNFSDPGVPTSPPAGQVLGASTLAPAGSLTETLYLIMMVAGGLLTAVGIKTSLKET